MRLANILHAKNIILAPILLIILDGPLNAIEKNVIIPDKYHNIFDNYCKSCHNPKKKKGKIRLDAEGFSFDIKTIEDANKWQKVLESINSKEMPPEDEKQIPETEKADFLEVLSQKLVQARSMLADSGGKSIMRRMNRREYRENIKTLLNVDVDVADLPDDKSSGFDTDGASLFMSSGQIEVYQSLAKSALSRSLEGMLEEPLKVRRETEVKANKTVRDIWRGYFLGGYTSASKYFYYKSKDKNVQATDFGLPDEVEAKFRLESQFKGWVADYVYYTSHPLTQTGMLLTFEKHARTHEEIIEIPIEYKGNETKINTPLGLYKLRLRVGTTPEATPEYSFLEMHVNGKRVKTFHISSTAKDPMVIEIEHEIKTDADRKIIFKPRINPKASFDIIQKSKKITGKSPDPSIWIDWVEWEGPIKRNNATVQRLKKFITSFNGEEEYLKKELYSFSHMAFRGIEPSSEFIEKLIEIFNKNLTNGKTKKQSIINTLSIVLSSPSFIYMPEKHSDEKAKYLDSRELAVKLAAFLWSSPPDPELLKKVSHENLSIEVSRMLKSPKLDNFIKSFLHQWLSLDRLEFFQFDTKKFPFFDDSLKESARQEVYETFKYILLKNLNSKYLLKSDFVIVDSLLANHYGLKNIKGDHFQQVLLPADSPRGGLLGMTAILAMGSNGSHTSPVERGAWILRKILNDPPPPAPANVPQLNRLEGKNLTVREMISVHQEEAQCAHCHRKIDPLGFGLENFDSVGRWRTEYNHNKKKNIIDPSGKFHNGPEFNTYFEMRDIIASKEENFNKGLIKAMLEYALGRKVGFTDQTLVEAILKDMKEQENSLQALILSIVNSQAFKTKK